MATNIIIRNIDEKIHKSLKIQAVNESITLQDLIKRILTDAVKPKK